ncbi:MAG: extracellular solute-binding protein, partial [Candidatus Hydrogenedens sp.]
MNAGKQYKSNHIYKKGVLLFFAIIFIGTCSTIGRCEDFIRIYYWGNELDLFAGETVRDFEHLYNGTNGKPKIKVVMGQSASLNKTDDPQRLLCAVAGGDPPDVVFFDRFAVAQWASRGAFRCLQDFYERDLKENPDDPLTLKEEYFFPPCWQESQYQGKLYAIPCDTDNRGLYYNLDLLEKYAEQLKTIG